MNETVTLWEIATVVFIPLLGILFLLIKANNTKLHDLEKNLDEWKLHTVENHHTKQEINIFTAELKSEFKIVQKDIRNLYSEIKDLCVELRAQHKGMKNG